MNKLQKVWMFTLSALCVVMLAMLVGIPGPGGVMPLGLTNLTGLAIGDGTPDVTPGNDDLYVEGTFEVDDAAYFDGAVDMDSTADIAGALTLSKASGNGLVVTSNCDLNGSVNVAGVTVLQDDVTISDGALLIAQTAVSVTSGGVISPVLGIYVPLESAGAYTTDTTTPIQDGTTTGQLLILQNTNASDAITVDGTGGNVECKANVALGAQDTMILMWNGADWICLSTHDNS